MSYGFQIFDAAGYLYADVSDQFGTVLGVFSKDLTGLYGVAEAGFNNVQSGSFAVPGSGRGVFTPIVTHYPCYFNGGDGIPVILDIQLISGACYWKTYGYDYYSGKLSFFYGYY